LSELPVWWDWPLALTLHAEFRMQERGLGEVQLRTLLEGADRVYPTGRRDRWKVLARLRGVRWTVVLEPDEATRTVLVITVFRT